MIRGRSRNEGGPYRVFRCLRCRVENGVIEGPAGGWMLYPLAGLAPPHLLDRLLSVRERSRLAKARLWWTEHRADVERFRRGEAERRATRPRAPRPVPSAAAASPPRRPATTGPRAVLGVPEDATLDEVRRAFRRLAKRHHPDRAGVADGGSRFREVRAAYEVLLRELG